MTFIDCAAILDEAGDPVILSRPYRHPDIMLEMQAKRSKPGEQGFMTNEGEFVDRTEAMNIARKANQLIYNSKLSELYTEDLW